MKLFREIDEGRDIIIGDVHGCYDELQKLLDNSLDFDDAKDRLWFVGDLIYKGPKSFEVLNLIHSLGDRVQSVLGNQELSFRKDLSLVTPDSKKGDFSSVEFLGLYRRIREDNPKIIEMILDMPGYIHVMDAKSKSNAFTLVHAGKLPGKKWKDHTIEELTRINFIKWSGSQRMVEAKRSEKGAQSWTDFHSGRIVFHGHNSGKKVRTRGKVINIDTSCVYGGSLSAIVWQSGEIYTQKSEHRYS